MQAGGNPTRWQRFVRGLRRAAPTVLFIAAVTVYYVFVISAGTWTHWPTWTTFYERQAAGFRQGHLYLPEAPSRTLMALREPLNPANMRFWRWDHSYHRGHLYAYWGLVPPLLLALLQELCGLREAVSDDIVVFAFVWGRLLVGTLLIRKMSAIVEPRPARWAVGSAMLVFAIAHPTPYTLARAGVYEGAIAGGAFFMLTGLSLALAAMSAPDRRPASLWLAAAGLSFGLASGCRISLLPTAAVITLLAGWFRGRIERAGGRRTLAAIGVAAAGAAIAIGGHLALNRLRFGAWMEFGARYQMGYPPLLLRPRFLIPNVWTYLLSPPWHACEFPFLSARWYTTRLLAPAWIRWPLDHHTTEPTVGLLAVVPYVWLIAAGAVGTDVARDPPDIWRRRWLWSGLTVYTAGGLAPVLLLSATTMRYEGDFASGLLLLATLSGWRVCKPAPEAGGRKTMRRLFEAIFIVLAAASVGCGTLLGFGGYFGQFDSHNPKLLRALGRSLDVCGKRDRGP